MASKTDRLKLLDGVAASGAPDYGEGWQQVPHFDDIHVHVFGLGAGDEVQVEVANEDGTPSNPVIETTLSGAGPHSYSVPGNPYQVRVGVTTDGANGSNVTAIVHVRKRN